MRSASSHEIEVLAKLPLVDHHCHGVVAGNLGRPSFEELITESPEPPPPGTSSFDSPLGLVLRRCCAPVLDLEPGCDPDRYLERRRELGAAEVNRRLLRAAGCEALLVDTGYAPHIITAPSALAELAGAPAHEVVRIESIAERVLEGSANGLQFEAQLGPALDAEAEDAVGLKSVIAYRGGFELDPEPPDRESVVNAADQLLARGGDGRLTDPTLLRFGIWTAAEIARRRGQPIQFHAGFGDPDLTLHLADPSLLTGLIRRLDSFGVDMVLLHCYPYQRQAAYLASVFAHVYFDLGLALSYTGPGAATVLAEAMEMAPFTKQLYSSDGFGLAEMHHLGAAQFRRALATVLGAWVDAGECTTAEAERIATLIASANARRIYRISGR